ncbi:MAG: type II toxin-antitoxin system RelE/ParE family toxin [Chakrabartia sp.]
MTTFDLEFLPSAQKEWDKLGSNIRTQFVKKLRERLSSPRLSSAQLRDMPDCYKIKLRSAGYRLVYKVFDDRVVVTVIAVGKRERNMVYKIAAGRV